MAVHYVVIYYIGCVCGGIISGFLNCCATTNRHSHYERKWLFREKKKKFVPATEKDIITGRRRMGRKGGQEDGRRREDASSVSSEIGVAGGRQSPFPSAWADGREGGRDEKNKILNDRSRTRLTFLRRAIRG